LGKIGIAEEKKAAALVRGVDAALLGLFRCTRFSARFLPPSWLVSFSNAMGYALFHLLRKTSGELLKTIGDALPEITDQRELKRIASRVLSSPFRFMLDPIFLERYGERISGDVLAQEDFRELMRRFEAAEAEGRGVIIYSIHTGGIAIGHCFPARYGKPYPPLVMPPSRSPVPRYLSALIDLIQSLGADPERLAIWVGEDVISQVNEQLGRGKRLGMTFDLAGGTVVEFLGRPTAISSGIAHFAYDSGALILPACVLYGKRPLQYIVKTYDPITYDVTGDRAADVRKILEEVVKVGEEMIREAPEQWMGWLGLRGWRKRAERKLEEVGTA
jgi:lauroyl/myristoyl acyltransferase